ncbi:hypothetical protein ElyMa_001125500 [Elysia marginata]|uniref:Guanylate kinase-like domain-containing protein n=1 Tax=Elysia marginata TaxID=1093978 RepID=A0AAV4HXU6_9GAST|nr:hypothetical protein ElyMa_001125500 [Elysia marginata]
MRLHQALEGRSLPPTRSRGQRGEIYHGDSALNLKESKLKQADQFLVMHIPNTLSRQVAHRSNLFDDVCPRPPYSTGHSVSPSMIEL